MEGDLPVAFFFVQDKKIYVLIFTMELTKIYIGLLSDEGQETSGKNVIDLSDDNHYNLEDNHHNFRRIKRG